MNTTKLFSNLNGISFKGFPNVRWNVILVDYLYIFNVKSLIEKLN